MRSVNMQYTYLIEKTANCQQKDHVLHVYIVVLSILMHSLVSVRLALVTNIC